MDSENKNKPIASTTGIWIAITAALAALGALIVKILSKSKDVIRDK